MPPPETMYCAQQISIPPELPDILKQFTKAAIKTQPRDVLQWATDYFSALSKGQDLPVKERLEMPVATQKTDTGLTPGLLKILHKQLDTILALGNFSENINWMQFSALGCSALGGTITSALKHACEILTEDPEGGAAQIPFNTFQSLYTYLAHLDGEIPKEQIDSFLHSLEEQCQGGMVQPSNFTSLHSAEKSE
ncbi:ropporin-1-like protein isoform X2 [Sinocyclocheilus rhinocerous]|uniref:ropporin-1-like protein isoform X2 n=1 Tax=Sinocyclocheilus rhinocerous TaxID=307959 RepID=UPI0007BA27EC|nr:PREDICTED: ropporin-1-like protein isoform X2 [Sinocyclocheilus rhinocerous]